MAEWPVTLYFSNDDKISLHPFPDSMKSRKSNKLANETSLLLKSFLALKEGVMSHMKSISAKYKKKTIRDQYTEPCFYDDWDTCLNKRKGNLSFFLPTRDATYGTPMYEHIKYEKGVACVVIGVIHSKVLKAISSSVGIFLLDKVTKSSFHSQWFQDTRLLGSASRYLPNDENSHNFFAIDYFPPGKCLNLSHPQYCVEYINPIGHHEFKIGFGERIYGVYETKVGPDAANILPSEMLSFHFSVKV